MSDTGFWRRLLLLLGGAAGGVGVLALAAGAHGGGPASESESFTTAGLVLTIHAGALVAIANASLRWRLLRFGGLVIASGAGIFAGDLILRALIGERLFAMAAPSGGMAMMAGWAIVALSALLPAKEAPVRPRQPTPETLKRLDESLSEPR